MKRSWTLLLTSRHEFMDFIIAEILSLCEQECVFEVTFFLLYSRES